MTEAEQVEQSLRDKALANAVRSEAVRLGVSDPEHVGQAVGAALQAVDAQFSEAAAIKFAIEVLSNPAAA